MNENGITSQVNQDGSVSVTVDMILDKMGAQIAELSIKQATSQCTVAALQSELQKVNIQLDQAQKMVNSMLQEKLQAKSHERELARAE